MPTDLIELLPELVELVFFAASGTLLSVASVLIERFAFDALQHGDVTIGAWAGVVGAVALGFAYLLVTDKFGPKLAAVKTALDDSAE